MPLDIERTTVQGRWLRHAPAGFEPATRPRPPGDNRWQRGDVVDALYLCADVNCVWAEWYRHLAERGVPPQRALPRALWTYEINPPLEVADLSTLERLATVGLPEPSPGRNTWPQFQSVGERLYRDGLPGLLAPSAARPQSHVLCLFLPERTPPAEVVLRRPPKLIAEIPPPPTGMRT